MYLFPVHRLSCCKLLRERYYSVKSFEKELNFCNFNTS